MKIRLLPYAALDVDDRLPATMQACLTRAADDVDVAGDRIYPRQSDSPREAG